MVARTVFVVDDEPEFLQLARWLLGSHPGLTVIGEATSGTEAVARVPVLRPDVVVIDVQMPGLNGFETARELLARLPHLRVLMVSAFDEPHYHAASAAVGAGGFTSKRRLSADAVDALFAPD